jgi:ubiquinone/menaquinone biosynthesis C-methylase UbiE
VTSAADVKGCCAAVYSSEAVHWLLGDALHPGGAELTERLARTLGVGSGDVVLDIGSGFGTSALVIARATGCAVVGVDLSRANVERAAARAADDGLVGRVRFVEGDAEALPLPDASTDGAMSECSLCLVPDKAAATRELARVLRPGARVAISDVTARPAELPPELRTLSAWTACLADARPLAELAALLEDAGLVVEELETHDQLLRALVERVESRLRLAQLLGDGIPAVLRDSIAGGAELVAAARQALDAGVVGYGAVYATRP